MNMTQVITDKLTEHLQPSQLVVENVSHHHAGHASSPGTGQSHFQVAVTSEAFRGLPKVARFRLVHRILQEEMAGPIHALSMELKAPGEA